ncbi:sugar transferase [Stappia sp. GBMRC 2046]|uniref:Sugar transferase n=1 Tax=Stappia sediminis TaxID=2692190 RepID=A0A7X3LY16_9HYPH|nr:sugar transferase [Stappia sediminis]MXN67224.1 sugar transferase [Stappia sediminis]
MRILEEKRAFRQNVRPSVAIALSRSGTGSHRLAIRADLIGRRLTPILRRTLNSPLPVWKRGFDIAVSLAAIMVLAPVLLMISALVAMDGGPVIYSCKRPGAMKRSFRMFKFRTMKMDGDRILEAYFAEHPDARAEYNKRFKLRDDPRIAGAGRFLRRYSLDELPQLFNVLRGDMSIVGPRPRGYNELTQACLFDGADFDAYFRVPPGMTGLWQVSGRSDTDYGIRIQLDAEYVRTIALKRDVAIVLRTIPALLSGRGAY